MALLPGLVLGAPVYGQSGPPAGPAQLVLLPDGPVYAPYLADPHEQRISLEWMQVGRVDIPDTGSSRFGLHVGGEIGLLRGDYRGAWQLNITAGYKGQFDNDENQDNIGWDGDYGLSLEWAPGPRHAAKFFVLHTSSHIGDEYIERTGRSRIDYTREEVGAALSWWPSPRWRGYLEAGWAYDLRNTALQAPWRAQAGLEYETPRSLLGGRLGWYAAADLSATEERDWRRDTALTLGVVLPGEGEDLRLDLQYVNGRPFLGEFFRFTEEQLSLRLSTRL